VPFRFVVSVMLALILVLLPSTLSAQNVAYKVITVSSPFSPSDTVVGTDISRGGALPLNDITNRPQEAFVWKAGKSAPLTLLGGSCSTANGINNAGHIVGGACPAGETLPHAYLYQPKKVQDLGTFGGTFAVGLGVNHLDQISGYYELSDGSDHTFFWNRNKWTDIGNLGGSFTYGYSMNRSAVVTGQSDISNDPDPVFGIPPFHGFQWSAGILTDFGQIFGSDFNYGNNINDSGMSAGAADVAGDTGAHAIIWDNGTVQDLTPGSNFTAWGIDINNQNQVVGSWGGVDPDPADGPPVDSMECPCYAVLWQNGQTTFLEDVVPAGWSLLLGLAINDKGEILARGSFNGGPLGTVLLKPLSKQQALTPASTSVAQLRSPYKGPRAIVRDAQKRIREIW